MKTVSGYGVEPTKRCLWQMKRGGERKKQGELRSEPASRATMFLTVKNKFEKKQ